MRRYLIVIERGESNYSAYSPDLPGRVATGATRYFRVSAVNAPGLGVPPPMPDAPVSAHVWPRSRDAFRLVTAVVLATTNGAVPVATVLVICEKDWLPAVLTS